MKPPVGWLLVVVAGVCVGRAGAYDPFQADLDAKFDSNTTSRFHSRLSMSFAQVCLACFLHSPAGPPPANSRQPCMPCISHRFASAGTLRIVDSACHLDNLEQSWSALDTHLAFTFADSLAKRKGVQ